MDAHSLSQNGYVYRKRPRRALPSDQETDRAPQRPAFDLIGRIRPLYEQAGMPFGTGDDGLWLWLAFGRRTHGN